MLGEQAPLLVVLRRNGKAQEHRFCRVGGEVRRRRMAASVLQVAALAGARIVQRAETVGARRRRRRGDPQLAEDGVADLELGFALEADAAARNGRTLRACRCCRASWRCRRGSPRRARWGSAAGSPACTAAMARHTDTSPGSRSSGRRPVRGFGVSLVGMRAYRPTAGDCGARCSTMPHGDGPAARPCRLIT